MRRLTASHLLFLLCLSTIGFIGASGCGHSATGPSGSGATISGTIGAGTASGVRASGAHGPVLNAQFTGLTVSVVGTGQSATVDQSDAFMLNNVPSGDVTLRFQGQGIDSSLTVRGIEANQDVTIAVAVIAGAVQLTQDTRQGGPTTVSGLIDSIPSNQTVVVNGVTIRIDATTVIAQGSSILMFSDLTVGTRVSVSGTMDGAEVVATRVDIQDATSQPVTLTGAVQGFSGTSASFQFTIGATTVRGDSSTNFLGANGFSKLANGKQVQVIGQPQNGFVQATSITIS